MGESMQPSTETTGVSAALVGIAIGAGLSLFLRRFAERIDYDPVAEAQRIARNALGIE